MVALNLVFAGTRSTVSFGDPTGHLRVIIMNRYELAGEIGRTSKASVKNWPFWEGVCRMLELDFILAQYQRIGVSGSVRGVRCVQD